MKKLGFPDALVLITCMVVLMQLVSYLIPQGQYDRADRVLIKGTYRELPRTPEAREALQAEFDATFQVRRGVILQRLAQIPGESAALASIDDERKVALVAEDAALRTELLAGPRRLPEPRVSPLAFITSIPKSMKKEETAEVIFFVLLIGGAIAVMRATGAIDAFLGLAIRNLGHRPLYLVAGMTTIFAIGSATIGMAEEYLPFLPVLVTLAIALGMDAIVGIGIICVGYSVGYGAAVSNPFTVVVAQKIAGVAPVSGAWFRFAFLAVCLAIGIHHLLAYAHRVRKDPSKSLVRNMDMSAFAIHPEPVPLTRRRGVVLVLFLATIGAAVYGITKEEWYLIELSAIFIAYAVLAGLAGGLSPNALSREFLKGASELAGTGIIIGFAKTIATVMDDAVITDTVIHWIEQGVSGFGPSVTALAMLCVQTVTNFFIPSGSGQAYVTMPIMTDIATVSGVTQQTAVLAYQMGDGFSNIIIPTNAIIMGMLAMVKVPYLAWARFLAPFFLKIFLACAAALLCAVAIGYGAGDLIAKG